MQEPSKKDEAREVQGHAPGEEEGSRTGGRLVVVNQGQLEAGRDDHDAPEDRQEDITQRAGPVVNAATSRRPAVTRLKGPSRAMALRMLCWEARRKNQVWISVTSM